MMEAAKIMEGDPGWGARLMTAGLAMGYTWQHNNGNFYTVENLIPWTVITHARINPLLAAMDELLKQKTDFKP